MDIVLDDLMMVSQVVNICSISEYAVSRLKYGVMLLLTLILKLPKDKTMVTGGKLIMEIKLSEMTLQSTRWISNSKSAMGQIYRFI